MKTTDEALAALLQEFNRKLDLIHAVSVARFRFLARSIGQRTRVNRIHRSTGIGY